MKQIHLVIPMSGQGVRYQKAGYKEPKPLVPISGLPMIKRVLDQFPKNWSCHFILAENHRQTPLPRLLKKLRHRSKIYFIEPHAKGPGHALMQVLPEIPKDVPVFVSYCDYGMSWAPAEFERFVREKGCDACLISYRGFHAHYLRPTLYAYSRLQGDRVVEVREKGHFTPNREDEFASAGGYYFKSAQLLMESLSEQVARNLQLGGELYTSLTVQALLLKNPQASVRIFEIPGFFQWGTPEDLKDFEYWEKTFQSLRKRKGKKGNVSQILMPMAGYGRRFSSLFSEPKPFIRLGNSPMFEKALDSLPHADHVVLVALESARDRLRSFEEGKKVQVCYLASTPGGQALSTREGLKGLSPTGDVVVSSCDHAIVLDPLLWKKFRANPGCDAAILTVKGYPGVSRSPRSYSYVQLADGNSQFPRVAGVSVKQPLSDQPQLDPLLVGTFWFQSAAVIEKGIQLLLDEKIFVNNELYLDSIFDLLQKVGMTVKMIPLDGFICWGDPESMKESLYWEKYA